MKKIFTKTKVLCGGFFFLGLVIGIVITADVPEKWIVERAKKYAMEYFHASPDDLSNFRMRETIRVEFNGGLHKGGIEVDMEKNTGKLLEISHHNSPNHGLESTSAPPAAGTLETHP